MIKEYVNFVVFILVLFFAIICVSIVALPQSLTAGAGVTLMTPSVENRGTVTPGIYGETSIGLPANFQFRAFGELLSEPTIPTLFDNDGPGSKNFGGYEIRLRPALRYSRFEIGSLKPFVEAGFDYYRHTFADSDTPKGSHRYRSGLNPYFGLGAKFGYNHEAGVARLFEDNSTLNRTQLRGWRANYDYTRPINDRFSFKAGVEAEYLKFYECPNRYYCETYFERDVVYRIRAGFTVR